MKARLFQAGKPALSFACWLAAMCLSLAPPPAVAQTTAAQPPAEKVPAIKNVLFIVSDDLRANVLGCYGDKLCETPNIDRLAREGMLFERAYCQGVSCSPSRISFMFGRYKGQGETNVAEYFKSRGWYTARAGKIYHMRVPGDIIAGTDGRDIVESWTERFNSQGNEAHTPGDYECLNLNIFTREEEGRQSTAMPHRMFVAVRQDGDGTDQPDHKTAGKIIELLRKNDGEPFFLAAGFVRPHYPMVAPPSFFDRYPHDEMILPEQVENDLEDIPKLGLAGSRSATNGIHRYPDNQLRMWSSYYAAVTFMDEQVGRILDELDRLGLRESTAIVFTSDHGYHLGDHTFWQKANLHEKVIRVPLIISAPGLEPGRTDSIVELVDMYPTLTELAGLPTPNDVQGTSLVPVLHDSAATVKQGALSLHAKGHSWRTANWAYMRYRDGAEELYDMRVDPGQYNNMARDKERAETLKSMVRELDQRLKQAGLEANRDMQR